MSRPGLYFLVILAVLNSCSADDRAAKALRILAHQFPDSIKAAGAQP